MLLIFSGLAAVAFGRERRRPPRVGPGRQSGLVIGPAGLALVQGDVRGELRWDEMRDVQFCTSPRSFRLEAEAVGTGIHLVVEGARIVIADVFDRPLSLIYDRIRSYWQGREANA